MALDKSWLKILHEILLVLLIAEGGHRINFSLPNATHTMRHLAVKIFLIIRKLKIQIFEVC